MGPFKCWHVAIAKREALEARNNMPVVCHEQFWKSATLRSSFRGRLEMKQSSKFLRIGRPRCIFNEFPVNACSNKGVRRRDSHSAYLALWSSVRGRPIMFKTLHTWHNEEFLKLLRASRARQRLRQADLAQRLGRDQPTVSKVESGARRLDVIELRAWLHALDIDFLAFMAELNDNLALRQIADPRLGAKERHKPGMPGRLVDRRRRS